MVFEINLLPEKYRKQKLTIHLDARALGIVAGVALIALVGWMTVTQGKTLTSLEDEVGLLTTQKAPLETQRARLRRMEDQLATVNQNIATLEGLGRRNDLQLRILEIVQREVPDNVWLRDFNQDPPAGTGRGQAAGPPANRILNLNGAAMRKEGIAEFIARLKEDDIIQEVTSNFIRPLLVPNTSEYVFEFSLTATLNIPQ